MSIDWVNPSAETLEGLEAGRNERQAEIEALQIELAEANERITHLEGRNVEFPVEYEDDDGNMLRVDSDHVDAYEFESKMLTVINADKPTRRRIGAALGDAKKGGEDVKGR